MNAHQQPRGGIPGQRSAGAPSAGGSFGGRNFDRDRPNRGEERATIALEAIRFSAVPPPTLFSDIAQHAAEEVWRGGNGQKNKPSQLRRFYDELVMWHEKVGRDETRFTECEPYIRMLKAKVAYAHGRDHVDINFRALFDRVVDEARDAVTLRQAKLFFEAFMAFYKVHAK
jgi:CRISPR-associated protein Csm2